MPESETPNFRHFGAHEQGLAVKQLAGTTADAISEQWVPVDSVVGVSQDRPTTNGRSTATQTPLRTDATVEDAVKRAKEVMSEKVLEVLFWERCDGQSRRREEFDSWRAELSPALQDALNPYI